MREPNPFLTDFEAFVSPLARFGCANSLTLVALKLTAPGVPDIYQGTETWAFSLVDSDNRRAVDFGALKDWLDGLHGAPAGESRRPCGADCQDHFAIR